MVKFSLTFVKLIIQGRKSDGGRLIVRAHLQPATVMRLRHHSEWVAKQFGGDVAATSLLPSVTVQTRMQGINLGAISQRGGSR